MRENMHKPGIEFALPPAGLPACGDPLRLAGCAASRRGNAVDFDYIVIGSGFGGSVSALRLTEKGYRVGVMEMGRRWTPERLAAYQLADPALDLAAGARRCAGSSISNPSAMW